VGLSVTVLGRCGSYPGPGGACSGYLVRGAGATVWVDAGSGTLANLQRHAALDAVDAVVLSHEHPDHWTDIEGFRVACSYVLGIGGVPVYAPAGLRERAYDLGPALDWQVVEDGDAVEVKGLRLSFSRTDHPPETLAVRADGDGRSLGYSADTGPGWSFEALGRDLDLALCEATFDMENEGRTEGHLSTGQAGAMAQAAGARRLVITHLWPIFDVERLRDEATVTYGAPVEVATEHEEYDL